jgi:hypothetical protein
MLTVFIYEP